MLGIGALPFFDLGKVSVGALQLFAPLPAVLIVRALCQLGALFGLTSQKLHRSHGLGLFAFPAFALHHFSFCDATKIAWWINRAAGTSRRQRAQSLNSGVDRVAEVEVLLKRFPRLRDRLSSRAGLLSAASNNCWRSRAG